VNKIIDEIHYLIVVFEEVHEIAVITDFKLVHEGVIYALVSRWCKALKVGGDSVIIKGV